MTDRTTPVSGPHPIHVQPIPAGATLDISEYVADLIVSIATDPRLLALFDDVVEALNSDRPGDPERLPVEHLVAQLDPRVHVYGRQVGALADRLGEIARTQSRPVAVPQGGAAA